MGMDFLDITFRIEKAFQIELSKDDFEKLVHDNDITAGDLYDLVLRKLHLRDVGRYDLGLNRALWSDVQQVLCTVTHIPIERIQLQVPLEELMPRETRRETWDALRNTCPYRIGELEYPRLVRVLGLLIAAAVVLIEQFHLWRIPGAKWFWPVLGALGCWMVGETYLKVLSICAATASIPGADANGERPLPRGSGDELCRYLPKRRASR